MSTYVVGGGIGGAIVSNADGTFSIVGGRPLSEFAPPSQEVLADFVTDNDSFQAPSIAAQGADVIAPVLFDDTDAFFAPTLTASASLLPALVASDDAFFTHVATSIRTLLASLVDDADTVPAPTVVVATSLLASLVTDPDTFPAPAVSASALLLPALVTDADTFPAPTVVAPGALVTLLPALVASDDAFPATTIAGVGATRTVLPNRILDVETYGFTSVKIDRHLLPSLVTSAEVFYATIAEIPPGGKDQKLRAARINSDDVIYQARFSHKPPFVIDVDTIFPVGAVASYTLRPGFIADDSSIPIADVARAVVPELVEAPDVIPEAQLTMVVLPQRVAGDDEIPAADVGWQVIAEFTEDADEVYEIAVSAYNDLLPEVLAEDDVIDTYPFFLQALTGGIPVPKPISLKGSISQPRRLTGSISSRTRLTGSIAGPRRLTGSISRR